MTRRRALRAAIAAVLAGSIGTIAYVAARQAISDFYAQTASLQIESWSRPGHKFSGKELQQAIGNLERSLSITPASAWGLEQMGSLQFARMRAATDAQTAVAAARASYRNFREALLQHPTSPFVWVNIALAKQSLGEIDNEFFAALEQSVRYGPWEPPVLLIGLQLGLGAWDRASPAQREGILQMRDRAVWRDPESVNRIARDYSRPELACDPKAPKAAGGQPCPRMAP